MGLNGRVTAEGEIKLPLIFSPIPFGRNDFHSNAPRGWTRRLTPATAVGDLPDRAARIVGYVQRAVGTLGQSYRRGPTERLPRVGMPRTETSFSLGNHRRKKVLRQGKSRTDLPVRMASSILEMPLLRRGFS